jgi:hypothetical protein
MYYEYFLIAHNWLRWIITIFLLLNIFRHLGSANKPWTKTDNSLGLILMIAAHLTLLIGLYQWAFGPWGLKQIQASGMATVMKDKALRFWAVEHITGMLIAIILITIGKGVGRKALPNVTKHRRTLILFTLALVVILATVPWPFREVIGRPWLRTT